MFRVKNSVVWFLVLCSLIGCRSAKDRADTFVPQQNWRATIDRSSLRFFATQASHVLLGTVKKVDTEAQVSDFSFANLEWKIYHDRVTLSLEQAVGESMPRNDIVLRLHPARCEAYSEGKPVNGTLSICQMRKLYNTLHEGERILVFLRGRLGGPQPPLVDLKFPVRGTEVDMSAVEKPPVPLEDAIQEILDGFRLSGEHRPVSQPTPEPEEQGGFNWLVGVAFVVLVLGIVVLLVTRFSQRSGAVGRQ